MEGLSKDEKGLSAEQKSCELENEKNRSDTENVSEDKKDENTTKKRKHRKYTTSINLTALKELEGTTAGSFLDLARAVILIDGRPYDPNTLSLSKSRKADFERLIKHYAEIEYINIRKYYIKLVYSQKQREEINEWEIKSKWDKLDD